MVKQTVRLALSGQWAQAGLEPPRRYPGDREQIARRVRDAVPHLTYRDDPRWWAVELGFRVQCFPVRGCGGGLSDDSRVVYSWHTDRQERGLRITHEIAHGVCSREGGAHSEADVWLLTGELAAPPRALADEGLDVVRAEAHAPGWFVDAWAAMARRAPPRLRP